MAVSELVPDLKTLLLAERANGDGGGFAWVEDNKVVWRKGITAVAINYLIEKKGIKPPMVIHFRLATIGGQSDELCHPFPITAESETHPEGSIEGGSVLFHNGHWGGYQRLMERLGIQLSGQVSDSRAIAACTAVSGEHVLSSLAAADGYGNRFVTLSPDGFKTYGLWKERSGILFSNLHFYHA